MRLCLPLCCVAALACTSTDGPLLSRVPRDAAAPGTARDATAPNPLGDATPPDAASEASVPDAADAAAMPTTHLVHHYTFDGTGTAARDSAGDADGDIVGASLSGTGDLVLPGGRSGPHVTLPAGLISSLESVTVEAWLTWAGGDGYQRVFDFGISNAGAGNQGSVGLQNFSLALYGNDDAFRLLFDADSLTDPNTWRQVYSAPLISTNSEHQLVAVFDRGEDEIRLYVDGLPRGAAAVLPSEGLSNIDDANNWLGMAQWAADPNFAGTLSDVRIYDVPMSDTDVMARFQARY